MRNNKSAIEFGVIGLGRFGFALATTLAEAGKEVLVIDSNENKIKQIRNLTENAFVVEDLSRENLEQTGIQNCETAIVCIGEKVDVSILTTLNLISMGIPRVIAKAISFEQGKVLEKIGAEVVYPEHDMAVRLANRLTSSRILDYRVLGDDITISELKLTKKLEGQTVVQADLRKRFGLNIIALQRGENTVSEITPELMLHENDIIVVVGKKDNIKRFEKFLRSQPTFFRQG